jgi:hypothetical protein
MPFMADTLGGRLGSGLRVVGFFADVFFAVAVFGFAFVAVFAFALGVAFFATAFWVAGFLAVVFFALMIFSPFNFINTLLVAVFPCQRHFCRWHLAICLKISSLRL